MAQAAISRAPAFGHSPKNVNSRLLLWFSMVLNSACKNKLPGTQAIQQTALLGHNRKPFPAETTPHACCLGIAVKKSMIPLTWMVFETKTNCWTTWIGRQYPRIFMIFPNKRVPPVISSQEWFRSWTHGTFICFHRQLAVFGRLRLPHFASEPDLYRWVVIMTSPMQEDHLLAVLSGKFVLGHGFILELNGHS